MFSLLLPPTALSDSDDELIAIGFISDLSPIRSTSLRSESGSFSDSSGIPLPFILFPEIKGSAVEDTGEEEEEEVLITSHSKRNNAQIVRRKISAEAAKDPTNN
jgi:hypothetical protein